MTTDADVIISGAGPAGAVAAYRLATRGVPVLILEKSQFPRYKVCGAGLTHKILQEIPFDVSEVFETTVHNIVFSRGFSEIFTRSSELPLVYCTMRDKFDALLLAKAVEAGARLIFGEKVTCVEQHPDHALVVTRTGSYRSRLVIGADGASSAVARSAGLRDNLLPGLAWEAEVTADPATVKAFSQTLFLDWGAFPGGYGWVFPKGDHFSVGVGGPAGLSKWMIPYYGKLVKYLENYEGRGTKDEGRNPASRIPHPSSRIPYPSSGIKILSTSSLRSWPIPVRQKASRFHNGRVIVAGDAGGLTDPLTGEGIYYAVRSGHLASEACCRYLEEGSSSMGSYTEAVNDELMAELTEANRVKYLFNTVPGTIHRFVRDSDRGWRAFGKVLRGERRYADVKSGFGKWRSLWSLTCLISRWISDFREKRFAGKGFK
jgi:geranylgeranyl reductase family protein